MRENLLWALSGRHLSRLEAVEVTSQMLKMEHAGGTHWQPEIWDNQAMAGQWPACTQSPACKPSRPDL